MKPPFPIRSEEEPENDRFAVVFTIVYAIADFVLCIVGLKLAFKL